MPHVKGWRLEATMTPDEAITIVAAQMVANAVSDWLEGGWEQLPDIGQFDYKAIERRMKVLTIGVSKEQWNEASSLLEGRARDWLADHE